MQLKELKPQLPSMADPVMATFPGAVCGWGAGGGGCLAASLNDSKN